MSRLIRRYLAASALATLGLLVQTSAGEWSQWGGTPQRNMVNPAARDLPTEWDTSTGENILWTADLGTISYGNPVVSEGRIFVGTNNGNPRDPGIQGDRGALMCFRADDGEFLWQATHAKLENEALDWPHQGVCSSPAVAGQRVYYVNNRGEVVCADVRGQAGQARIVWQFDMLAELGVQPRFMTSSNPLLIDDLVIVVTSNGTDETGQEVASPAAPSFVAFDKQSGQPVWAVGSMARADDPVRMGTILEGQWGSPAWGALSSPQANSPQVYLPGGDGWLYAVQQRTGDLIWKFDCNPADARWVLGGAGDRNYLVGTPVFDDNSVYIAVGQDPEHGGGPGHLYRIDATGQGDVTSTGLLWHLGPKQFGRSISTVAVHEGIVYAVELDGFLHAIDAARGEVYWSYDALSQVWGSPLVADGHVYLGDEDGDVVVLSTGREMNVVAECTLDDAIYGTPVAVGQVLYFATKSRLYALGRTAHE